METCTISVKRLEAAHNIEVSKGLVDLHNINNIWYETSRACYIPYKWDMIKMTAEELN